LTFIIVVIYASISKRNGCRGGGGDEGAVMSDNTQPETHDLVVSRDVPAPIEEAWKSWTEPDHVLRWWGPNGFTCTLAELDVRVGGTSLVCMSAPDWGFPAMYSTWAYTLVDAPRRLEFVHNIADEHGSTIDPATIGAPGIPRDVHHVITLEPMGDDVTRLTVTEQGYTDAEQLALSKRGLEESLDKLVAIYT
jgi:uncharacterized protein YndB with AHSA1/START domain